MEGGSGRSQIKWVLMRNINLLCMALRTAIVSLPLVTLHNRWGDLWMRHYAWFKLFSTQTRREKVSEI